MKSEMDRNTRTKKQVLNLIYFFDGGKTRTLKIPVSAVKAIFFVLAVLLFWGTIGSVFFVKNILYTKQISKQLQTAMETIFEYQVKYESVLDTVYRTAKKHKEPESELLETAESSHSEMQKNNPVPAAQAIPVRDATTQVNMLKSKLVQISAGSEENSVNVESPSLVQNDNYLNVSIALRNKGHVRAEGLVWAVAEWRDAQGSTFTTRSPDALKGKQALDRPDGNTFSIRQYKVKVLHFPIPDTAKSLSKIEIWVMDRKSNRSRFEITGTNQ